MSLCLFHDRVCLLLSSTNFSSILSCFICRSFVLLYSPGYYLRWSQQLVYSTSGHNSDNTRDHLVCIIIASVRSELEYMIEQYLNENDSYRVRDVDVRVSEPKLPCLLE